MATKIVVELEPGPEGDQEAKVVFDLFRSIDREMSSYKPDSALSRINREAGVRPVKVSSRLFDLLKASRRYGDLTGGAFDITFAALSDAWSFDKGSEPCLPRPEDVLARLPFVDYRLLELDAAAGTAYLPRRGMRIGLGGIAKGYALRLAAKRLHRMGVEDFLLSAGRQIYCAGKPRDRPAWRIGIQNPRMKRGSRLALVSLRDTSIATSGDNERFFVLGGVRYHHLLDPKSGYPARGVREVVVVCKDPVMADALATGLFVQGSLDLARALPGVEAAMLDDRGRFSKTKGFPLVSGFELVPLSEQASIRINRKLHPAPLEHGAFRRPFARG